MASYEKVYRMIIDSFPFFNETELCIARLNYLSKAVDKFVITESNLTWRCKPNNKKFDDVYKELDDRIKRKINYEFIEHDNEYIDSEEHTNKKTIQNISRDRLVDIARNIATDNDIFFYSDLDEFWDTRDKNKIVATLELQERVVCNMSSRFVYADWLGKLPNWPGTRITKLGKIQLDRPLSAGVFRYSKSGAFNRHYAIDSGWHFTYFGSNIQREEKMSNIKNGMDWESKKQMTYAEIAASVNTVSDWNRVVRKKKMGVNQMQDPNIDRRLMAELRKFPIFFNKEQI